MHDSMFTKRHVNACVLPRLDHGLLYNEEHFMLGNNMRWRSLTNSIRNSNALVIGRSVFIG